MPPLDPQEASGMINGSEQILKEYAKKASLTAKDIKALIEDVLHNPNFNAAEVDTDMLQRFANSIDSGDLDIISMHLEGDGAQKRICSSDLQRRFCENCYPTYGWLDVSTLASRSTWMMAGSSWK